MISDDDFYTLADRSHFLGAWVSILTLQYLFGGYSCVIASAVVMLWAGIKEFVIDPKEETAEVAGSGWRDLYGYLCGVIAGLGVVVIRWLIYKQL